MIIIGSFIVAILHIHADHPGAGKPGGMDDGIAVIAQIHVHGGGAVRGGIADHRSVAGEVQHGIAAGGDRALGRAVAADRAAVHVEGAGFNRAILHARHIDRAAVLDSAVAGHGGVGHGEGLCLMVHRAALVRLIIVKGRAGDGHFGGRFCIDRAALAVLRVVGLVPGEGAAGDGDMVRPDAAGVARLSRVIPDGAARHGEGRFRALIDCAAVLPGGIAGDGDAVAVDADIRLAIDRTAAAAVVLILLGNSVVATQHRRTGQNNRRAADDVCGFVHIERAAVARVSGTAENRALDGNTRGSCRAAAEAFRRVHAAAVRGLAIRNAAIHGERRFFTDPDRAAVAGGRGIAQGGVCRHRQGLFSVDPHNAAVFVGGVGIPSAVKGDVVEGQIAVVHDHAAALKAAGDHSKAVSVRGIGVEPVRLERGAEGDVIATGQGHLTLHLIMRLHHFDAQLDIRARAVGGKEADAAADGLERLFQLIEYGRGGIGFVIVVFPVVELLAPDGIVHDLAHQAVAIVAEGNILQFANLAFCAVGKDFIRAACRHIGAEIRVLVLRQILLHLKAQFCRQTQYLHGLAVGQLERADALVKANRRFRAGGVGLVLIALCVVVLGDAGIFQRDGEAVGRGIVARNALGHRLGDGQIVRPAGVGEEHTGDAGGGALIFAHVLAEVAGDGCAGDSFTVVVAVRCGVGLSLCQGLGDGVVYTVVNELKGEARGRSDLAGLQREGCNTVNEVHVLQVCGIGVVIERYLEVERHVLIRRPVTVHELADREEGICAPVDEVITDRLHTAQIDIHIVDEAMQVFVVCPGAEGRSVYAVIVPYRTRRCINTNISKGAKAVGVDGGIVIVNQMYIAGISIQGVAADDRVAGKMDLVFQIDTARFNGGAVPGNLAAGHIDFTRAVYRAAVLGRAIYDASAGHIEFCTCILDEHCSATVNRKAVFNQTALHI